MKNYLAVFTGNPNAMAEWEKLSEAERNSRQAAGMKGWHDWAQKHQKDIVQMGGPLSRTKLVDKSGIRDIRNNLGAFTVVQAESQQAAAEMFVGHPHFMLFPGEGVEVMEVMPIPGMP